MSTTYVPGEWSRQYNRLPPADRAAVADQVDEMFRRKTGITRRLDPAKDRELMRTWLRIRDELMERRVGGAMASSKTPGPYAGKGLLITGSVGKGAHNYEPDVMVVKSLLNELAEDLLYNLEEQWLEQPDGSKAMEVVTLALTGRVGPSTIERIERFQQRVVGLTNPDGRIDPGNKTLNELLRYVLHSGEVVPLRTLDGRIYPSSEVRVWKGPQMVAGVVFKRGLIVNGLDGQRLILSITGAETIFMLLDRSGPGSGLHELSPARGRVWGIYAQNTEAFIDEYITYFWKHMSDVLSPWVTLIEAEVNLLMAIGTTITGTAIYYGGFLAADFIAKNRRKFKHWIAIFQAVAAARSELKVIAPTLYSKLFDALFEFYVRSLTPQNAAWVIGKIIGLGGVALLERKLGLLKKIFTLILTTVLALLKNVADSLARAEQLWSTGIRALVAELQAQDVTVTPQEQRAIFEEIRAHPDEIRRIFQRLVHEIDAHLEGAT